jgi:hypothetical protein
VKIALPVCLILLTGTALLGQAQQKAFYAESLDTGDAPRAFAKTQRDMLKCEREKGELFPQQIIRYFAPFVLTFRGPLK